MVWAHFATLTARKTNTVWRAGAGGCFGALFGVAVVIGVGAMLRDRRRARWHAAWGAGAGAVGGADDGVDALLWVDGRVLERVQFEALVQVLCRGTLRARSVEIERVIMMLLNAVGRRRNSSWLVQHHDHTHHTRILLESFSMLRYGSQIM